MTESGSSSSRAVARSLSGEGQTSEAESESDKTSDIAIIGAGPVGLFAVFEFGLLGMKCQVIDALDHVGGQCAALYPEKPIYDIPGFPRIDAGALIERLSEQAAHFAPILHLGEQVTKLTRDLADSCFRITTDKGREIMARAVVIAAGVGAFGPNRPPIKGIEKYEGKSVFYAVKNKEAMRGKNIVIAGGGDSALDWALALAGIAKKIYLVHRRAKFRAAPATITALDAAVARGEVDLVTPYQLAGLTPLAGNDGHIASVELADLEGGTRSINADILLAFFGLSMNLGPINDWGLGLSHQHIVVEPASMVTNTPGIFAIGDIAHYAGKLKLILTGFAEAAQAAHAARSFLNPGKEFHFVHSTSAVKEMP